jgi:hypothetical protein
MFTQAPAILVGELAVIGNEGPSVIPIVLPLEVLSNFPSDLCGEAMRVPCQQLRPTRSALAWCGSTTLCNQTENLEASAGRPALYTTHGSMHSIQKMHTLRSQYSPIVWCIPIDDFELRCNYLVFEAIGLERKRVEKRAKRRDLFPFLLDKVH